MLTRGRNIIQQFLAALCISQGEGTFIDPLERHDMHEKGSKVMLIGLEAMDLRLLILRLLSHPLMRVRL